MPKIPEAWLKLAKITSPRPTQSDVELTDIPRNIVQIVKAFRRFKQEKNSWIRYIKESREQSMIWVNRFLRFLLSPRKIVILDFDSTLVKLPINWVKLRKTLIEIGLLNPWESITRAFSRYWTTDTELYRRFSEVVEQHELGTINSAELLVKPAFLEKLKRYARLCIATKQTVNVVISILERFGLKNVIDYVIGRDSGFGPMKRILYSRYVELCGNSEVLVIDDGIEYLIEAYRLGYTPIHTTFNSYSMARSYRLGTPSGKPNDILSLVISNIKDFP